MQSSLLNGVRHVEKGGFQITRKRIVNLLRSQNVPNIFSENFANAINEWSLSNLYWNHNTSFKGWKNKIYIGFSQKHIFFEYLLQNPFSKSLFDENYSILPLQILYFLLLGCNGKKHFTSRGGNLIKKIKTKRVCWYHKFSVMMPFIRYHVFIIFIILFHVFVYHQLYRYNSIFMVSFFL